jgi:hypothetical protein
MNERVWNVWKKYKLFVLATILGSGLLLLVQFLVQEKLENLQMLITEQIVKQQETMISVAKAAAGSGSSEEIKVIIEDCTISERIEFDGLLSQLDTSYATIDLERLDNLFGRCGGFFAEQKAITAARLTREVEVYRDFVKQLDILAAEKDLAPFQVDDWSALASEEQKQSELFMSLVSQQGKIIKALLEGKRPESEEMKKLMQETQEVKQTLLVASKQASEIRSQLIQQ